MLKVSILDDDLQAVKKQLAFGVKLNKRIDGKPPLVLAIESGHEEIAIALIEAGASLSLPAFKPTLNEQRKRTEFYKLVHGVAVVFILDWVLSHVLTSTNRLHAPWPTIEFFTNGDRLGQACRAGMACLIGSIFTDNAKGFLDLYLGRILFELLLALMAATRCMHLQLFAAWCLQPTASATAMRCLISSVCCRRLKPQCHRTLQSLFPPPDHQGIDILDALLAYRGGTDSVAETLLSFGIFSESYVKSSLPFPNAYPAKIISWAADRGYHRPIQRLHELGFPPDGISQDERHGPLFHYHSDPPMVCSARSLHNIRHVGQIEGLRACIQLFLEKGAEPNLGDSNNRTAISLAAQATDEVVVAMLLDKGANPNIADSSGRLPLHFCSCAPAIIRALVDGGLDINASDMEGNTALHSTSQNEGNIDGIRILLEAQADPRLVNKFGQTAFQIVARYGDEEVLSLFLDAGSDVNAHASGSKPPILLACHRMLEKAPILQYLLDRGADPNISDGHGTTPLHFLCMWHIHSTSNYDDYISCIKALIQGGADVNGRKEDSNGVRVMTPIGLAAAHGAPPEIFKLLLDAGAEPETPTESRPRRTSPGIQSGPFRA
jgi:ankyrin repeat protein